jgi:antitoxin component YwqK of YwqJK toxin-antitoxin module
MNIKKFIQIVFFSFAFLTTLKGQKKVYFDEDWNPCKKSEASFYRICLPKEDYFEVKDYYKSGKLQFEGISKVKEEPLFHEGKSIWYYENGQIARIQEFKNNVPIGKLLFYYEDGVLKAEGNYVNGEFDGYYAEYFPSGKIFGASTLKNGVFDGNYKMYFSEDKPKFDVNYINGKVDGEYAFFTINGVFNKGIAKNGIQHGQCSDYFYEGGLRRIYTAVDGFVDGMMVEFSPKGDTVTKSFFEKGVPIYFDCQDLGNINGRTYKAKMKLIDSIEVWEVFRKDIKIIDAYFKFGYKTNVWNVYSYDGEKLLMTLDYSNSDCYDKYLQKCREPFDPFCFLSNRFDSDGDMIKDDTCNGIKIEHFVSPSEMQKKHPFNYYVGTNGLGGKIVYEDKSDEIIESENFQTKNNCHNIDDSPSNSTICKRKIGNSTYLIFASESVDKLKEIKEQIAPKDEEICFFYQKILNISTFSGERFMAFALSDVIKNALKNKTFDDVMIIDDLENKIFTAESFSGLSAYDVLMEEIEQ